MSLYNDLITGRASLSVIGLGYVEMPLAHAFSQKNIKVIGFDINVTKIATYKLGIDHTGEVGNAAIDTTKINFTSDEEALKKAKETLIKSPKKQRE